MAIAESVLKIIAAAVGIFLVWYFKDFVRQMLQLYQDWVNKREVEKAKREAEALAQKIQNESDELKKIEGR